MAAGFAFLRIEIIPLFVSINNQPLLHYVRQFESVIVKTIDAFINPLQFFYSVFIGK